MWIARLKSECRVTERSIQPVRCVRAYASGASAPDTDSAGRCGRVLPAAGLADFFARTVRWERQGLYEENECRVMKRNERKGVMCGVVKLCGVKRNNAATTWICRVGKT